MRQPEAAGLSLQGSIPEIPVGQGAGVYAAPTGSGKTLAAFLWSINRPVKRAAAGGLADRTSAIYVSPLKALGNDIEKNLQEPLTGILRLAEAKGLDLPEIRVALPEAVEALRAVRRTHADPERGVISAADPLNLVGILTPGSRVSPYSNQAILYRDGHLVDIGPLGAVLSRLRHTQKA